MGKIAARNRSTKKVNQIPFLCFVRTISVVSCLSSRSVSEAILNSRPLFSLSNDPADPQVITPAHYLIGRPLSAPAEPSLEDTKVSRLDRWQHLQLMREHFWRAWSRDYLSSLQPRKKNTRATSNVRPGMVVLLHDETQPPLSWKLGRITRVYPGDDGLVRAIDVFSNGATYRRPINKVSIIPIEDNVCSAPVLSVDTKFQPGGRMFHPSRQQQ